MTRHWFNRRVKLSRSLTLICADLTSILLRNQELSKMQTPGADFAIATVASESIIDRAPSVDRAPFLTHRAPKFIGFFAPKVSEIRGVCGVDATDTVRAMLFIQRTKSIACSELLSDSPMQRE